MKKYQNHNKKVEKENSAVKKGKLKKLKEEEKIKKLIIFSLTSAEGVSRTRI